jgi:carbonic anhydrase
MSEIDEVLYANEFFARDFRLGDLPTPPLKKLAIVACMDSRLSLDLVLGLKPGDAHVIRNAGGIVTEDALRSLIISHYLLGTQEIMIINHTDCGMVTFTDEAFRRKLEETTQISSEIPRDFYAFRNLEENVRQQIERVKAHPWLPDAIPVRGFIYDVRSGKLSEVVDEAV